MFSKRTPLLIIVLVFSLAASCSAGPDPVIDDRVPAVLLTRRDTLDGIISVYIDGKAVGKVPPIGRWGYRLKNGVHTISLEYRGMKTNQLDFEIHPARKRVEYDVWAFFNTQPNIQRKSL